jgi:hypothetical protein
VAAGFEPAEGCPSRAFEARSLGRSDTPPPERLPKVLHAREWKSAKELHGRACLHSASLTWTLRHLLMLPTDRTSSADAAESK